MIDGKTEQVPNSQSHLALAYPVFDEDGKFQSISKIPIIAWSVETVVMPKSEGNYKIVTPLTIWGECESDFAVFDTRSSFWWINDDLSGEGEISLMGAFKEAENAREK